MNQHKGIYQIIELQKRIKGKYIHKIVKMFIYIKQENVQLSDDYEMKTQEVAEGLGKWLSG